MDESGVSMASLRESGANVVHVSPEHHYPLGNCHNRIGQAPGAAFSWAAEAADRYIIEDDYDCEFRYRSPRVYSRTWRAWTQATESVIYMNTFSKTLTPAIRISYMVLPEEADARATLIRANFYSQYSLYL